MKDTIALFMTVRNSKILPYGMAKGYSKKEINGMAYATMLEILGDELIDWDRARDAFYEGKAEYERQKAEGRKW